jgi:hypothetical protein
MYVGPSVALLCLHEVGKRQRGREPAYLCHVDGDAGSVETLSTIKLHITPDRRTHRKSINIRRNTLAWSRATISLGDMLFYKVSSTRYRIPRPASLVLTDVSPPGTQPSLTYGGGAIVHRIGCFHTLRSRNPSAAQTAFLNAPSQPILTGSGSWIIGL